jgi:hypothetical protein
MAAMHVACRECGAGMSVQPLDPVCGRHGILKVTIIHLPVLVCANVHRRFAGHDFHMRFLDRILGEELKKIPAANSRGFLFRRHHCGACGARLDGSAMYEETFDFDIAIGELPGFRVELAVPVVRCGSCGRQQVRSLQKIRQLAPRAFWRAFQAADLVPG